MKVNDIDVKDVYQHFPFPKYRKYQKDVIKKIVNAFNDRYRFILLAAPTGFGKSAVNTAFCRVMRSFYISPQNVLLSQVNNDFSDLAPIKGRRHYSCVESKRKQMTPCNCNVGICKKVKNYKCTARKNEMCEYWEAKNRAITAQVALTNFAYFIGEGFIPDATPTPHFGNRELLVIDEGHNIDSHALGFISLTLSQYTLPREIYNSLNIPHLRTKRKLQKEELDVYLKDANDLCTRFLDLLPPELTETQIIEKREAKETQEKIRRYHLSQEVEWIGQITEKTRRIKARPVFAKGFMDYLLWRRADRFIISSATIFKNNFLKECGIPRKEAKYITAPSTFPVWNRPIINTNAGSLSYKYKHENFPKALKTIKKILSLEPGKGIIHAHSYGFAEAIRKEVSNSRLMFHTSKNRDEALQRFLDSPTKEGRILVAVAMTEGLDLKGDLANFQILFKCPYPSLGDLVTKYRMDKYHDWQWYNTLTLKTIIQAYGRAVRTKEDEARFYLVDSATIALLNKQKKRLPRFFKRAYKRMKTLENWK